MVRSGRRRRRPTRRIRGTRRRTRRISRGLKNSGTKVVHIRRSTAATLVPHAAGPSGTPYFAGLYFALTDILNYFELSGLFAEYRYNCVVVTLTPNWNVNTSGSGYNLPIVGWCYDYEDAVTPTTVGFLQEYSSYKETPFNKKIKIKVYPAINTLIYVSAGVNGFGIKRKQWVKASSADVKWYGIKYCVYNLAASQQLYWQIKYTAYISLRRPH